jgi:hypothetical protein
MKTSVSRWFRDLGFCCATTLIAGCAAVNGPGTIPGGYTGPVRGGYPPITYVPYPGGIPWYNVGYPRFPGNPYTPIVLNPTPSPGTPNPGTQPGGPSPNPTIPVVLPGPQTPGDDSLNFWSPWPLPPRAKSSTASLSQSGRIGDTTLAGERNSDAIQISQSSSQIRSASASGGRQFDFFGESTPTLDHSLKFHGGRTIRDLYYVNLYISGDQKWTRTDVEKIDRQLGAAMRDEHLNNVLLQYFDNQPIRSTALPSHPLVGYTPGTVTRGDIQNMIGWLHRQGFLRSFDLQNTVFNLLLPPGSVLTVDNRASIAVSDEVAGSIPSDSKGVVPAFEEGSSLTGLAGYHGSVVTAGNDRVYYAVSVYSERGRNQTTNGIPVFREPWKNVVATLYHQLVESRTNPDVEEAMRNESDGKAKQYLGWASDSGLEAGDVPLLGNMSLSSVFREVPLADGSGVVPVQLPWSNAITGPEGPRPQPHPRP